MPVQTGRAAAGLLLDLLDKPVDPNARLALATCVLRFSTHRDWVLAPESHGQMASLGVYEDAAWLFSFAPAQQWVLAYIRPPELRRGRLTLSHIQAVLPQAGTPQAEHISVRLRTHDDASLFCDTVFNATERHG